MCACTYVCVCVCAFSKVFLFSVHAHPNPNLWSILDIKSKFHLGNGIHRVGHFTLCEREEGVEARLGPSAGSPGLKEPQSAARMLRGSHSQPLMPRNWEEVLWAPGSTRRSPFPAKHPSSCTCPRQQASLVMPNPGDNCQRKSRSDPGPANCAWARSHGAQLLSDTSGQRCLSPSPSAGLQCAQRAKMGVGGR